MSAHSLRIVSDQAVVIRGGEMVLSDLRKAATKTERVLGRPGISVWSADELSAGELLGVLGSRLPHATVRLTTACTVRMGGFDLEPTLEEYHQTIWLPDCSDDVLHAVRSLFQSPVRKESLGPAE